MSGWLSGAVLRLGGEGGVAVRRYSLRSFAPGNITAQHQLQHGGHPGRGRASDRGYIDAWRLPIYPTLEVTEIL